MKKFLPAILAHVSAALSELLLMASAAWLIASAALHPPLSALSVGITLVRTAGISRAVLRYADRFLSHRVIFKFLDDLREELFRRAAARLPLKSGRSHEGELLHELTVTADLLKDFLPRVVLPLTTAALITIVSAIFLWRISEVAALTLLTTFVVVMVLSIMFKPHEVDDSEYRAKILDFNDARDELRIYGTAPAIIKLNDVAEKFGVGQMKIQIRQMNFDTLINILIVVGVGMMLWQISAQVDRVYLTVWALIMIAEMEIYSAIPNAVRTYKKIHTTADSPLPTNHYSLPTINCAIEFNNVNFGYNPAQVVLRNFNLKVNRGESLAIIGESGAGKTTLLYLMMRLFVPDSGMVTVDGSIAAATSTNYIFSDSIRYNFSVYDDNIGEEEILAALRICQLDNFDIDMAVGEDAANLSGGERLRLQIALAVAKNSDTLILDEPTAGLDKIRAEKLIDAVMNHCVQKNRTLIVITHDSDIAAKFDSVCRL